MRHLGFTGTRFGMKPPQLDAVRVLIASLGEVTGHYGDCVGADAEFHAILRALGHRVIGHPPVDDEHRASCAFDELVGPLTHMKRNKAIVTASDIVIGAPFEMTEQERGGTWKTIQMARKVKKPLVIAFPDGTLARTNWPNAS
ncbi:MAG: hypothetical protein WKG01_25290 [Kofleriaceae bacterium]